MLKIALFGGIFTAFFQTAIIPKPNSINVFVKMEMKAKPEYFIPQAADSLTMKNPSRTISAESSVDVNRITDDAAVQFHSSSDPRLKWPAYLFLVWIVGILVCGFLYLKKWRDFLLNFKNRSAIRSGSLYTKVMDIKKKAGIKRHIKLTTTSLPGCLFVLGLREICVSDKTFSGLDNQEQKNALAHEIAHLARNDSAWIIAVDILRILFFFQPLIHVASQKLQQESEFICDEWAITYTKDPVSMAKSLVKFFLHYNQESYPRLSSVIVGRRNNFVERSKRILEWNDRTQKNRSRLILSLLFLIIIFIAGWTFPRVDMNLLCIVKSGKNADSSQKEGSSFKTNRITISGKILGHNLTAEAEGCTFNKDLPYDFHFVSEKGFLAIKKKEGNSTTRIEVHNTASGIYEKSLYIDGRKKTYTEKADALLFRLLEELWTQN
jgi:beta-lactamase regulating signal transducer with metallopeptidase domain